MKDGVLWDIKPCLKNADMLFTKQAGNSAWSQLSNEILSILGPQGDAKLLVVKFEGL